MNDQVGPESALAAQLRSNRSYVIRAVRMSPHQREAFARLYDRYCLPVDQPFDRAAAFPTTDSQQPRPLILDIGFGMGMELAQLAQQRPEFDYLGVEIHRPGIGRLMGQLEERGLTNVKIFHCDAVVVLDRLLPRASIDGIHLFFPDPWPKKRHHKRRLVRPGFPELAARVIQPGGYLYMVTDWYDYAEQMERVVACYPQFTAPYGAPSQPRTWRVATAFERKGLAKGHNIYEYWFEYTPS